MFEVISDKKLKKILKPIYLDQEEYDEKVKEYTKQVKKIIPMFGKEGKEEYDRAFMGDHGHQGLVPGQLREVLGQGPQSRQASLSL